MIYQLRPCPFCGGEAFLERNQRAIIKGEKQRVSLVKCMSCHARSERFLISDFGHSSVSKEAEQHAVDAWNRRA